MASSIVTRLSFGLVVSPSAPGVLERFEELAAWLRENAKLELTTSPAATYKDLVTSVRDGSSDIAWLPPVAYAWLAEAVTPIGSIARDGATSYAGAIVARTDSELQGLADLKGVRAGWVDPWSAAGYVVPRLELARAKISPNVAFSAETFHGSHREALLALQKDECDVVGTYARLPPEGESAIEGAWRDVDGLHVRVLATSRAIPPDVIAVRRNLGPREYEHAARALREACTEPAAKPLVHAVFGGDELHAGIERGHDALRRDYELGIARGLFD